MQPSTSKAGQASLASRDAGRHWRAGGAHGLAGPWREAEKAHARAVRAAPSEALFWVNLGQSRRRLGDLDGALEAAEAALRASPGDGLATQLRLALRLQQHHYADAVADADLAALHDRLAQPGPNDLNPFLFLFLSTGADAVRQRWVFREHARLQVGHVQPLPTLSPGALPRGDRLCNRYLGFSGMTGAPFIDDAIADPVVPSEESLGRLSHAHLFLDTLPINAHTTASDALWAGVPVVTCLGDSFVGRVAASLLKGVGLEELVAADLDAYEAVAYRQATESAWVAAVRARPPRAGAGLSGSPSSVPAGMIRGRLQVPPRAVGRPVRSRLSSAGSARRATPNMPEAPSRRRACRSRLAICQRRCSIWGWLTPRSAIWLASCSRSRSICVRMEASAKGVASMLDAMRFRPREEMLGRYVGLRRVRSRPALLHGSRRCRRSACAGRAPEDSRRGPRGRDAGLSRDGRSGRRRHPTQEPEAPRRHAGHAIAARPGPIALLAFRHAQGGWLT
jgi:tetratricopeptide (TPR) repeat protein